MTVDQIAIFIILGCTLALFVFDRWRFDIVAVGALIASVLVGVVDPEEAFSGFGNAAVITVAAVLAISRALGKAGTVDVLVAKITQVTQTQFGQMAAFCVIGAFLSSFMNNVGALALLMPVAISSARKFGYSPSAILMPISFATLLGGMNTLIGTPPNLLIADFRRDALGEPFQMFDFTPTGVALSVTGIAFIILIGWRLIPAGRQGKRSEEELFEITNYVTEVRVGDESKLVGATVAEFEAETGDRVLVTGIVRRNRRISAGMRFQRLQADDVLMIQAETTYLQELVKDSGLELVERAELDEDADEDEFGFAEAVVTPNAWIQGSTPSSLRLRSRFGVNILAVSRQGRPFTSRLRDVRFGAGDVLLLEGDIDSLPDAIASLGCLPLADRKLVFQPRRLALPLVIFGAAIALTAAEVLSSSVAFVAAVLVMVLTGLLRPREVYDAIDWPVIVLLGAMIPVGTALETTGAAQLIADGVAALSGDVAPRVVLGVFLVLTMLLTPILNNAATVVIMAPIVIGIAGQLGVSADPFLIAVAIGASCDFLTPFGHQNNTLILGPGGYEFGDFWRMGLPLDFIIVAVSVSLIPVVWPF